MKTAIVTLTLEKKGQLEHIHVTLNTVVVPFQNGEKSTVKMEVLKDRLQDLYAVITGHPGGSIKITVDPGTPKTPISHRKSRIDVGQTADVSSGQFSVPSSTAAARKTVRSTEDE